MLPSSEPVPDLATSYGVDRSDGALRLVPLAHVGPGRTARFAFAAGAVFGLACLGGYVAFGFTMRAKIVAGPAWMAWVCPGGMLLPLAALAFAGCTKLYRTFRRPLIVEPSGPVYYGRQRLVAEGDAAGVTVERASCWVSDENGPDYERKTAYVYVATRDGRYVELPMTYYSNLDGWELGESLGAAVAAALGVPLSFDPPPAEHSTPQSRARNWSRIYGTVALIVGIPHFLGGFGLLAARAAALVDPAIRLPADAPPAWFAAIFLASGTIACTVGCRGWGGGWRHLARLLAALAVLEGAALLALHSLK